MGDPNVKMTPGAWLFAIGFAVSIVLLGIMALWALVYMLQWFASFWFPWW